MRWRRRVAEIVGRTPETVHKWRWPKSKGGTGGLIPSTPQKKLWEAAVRGEVDLSAEDFVSAAVLERRGEEQ